MAKEFKYKVRNNRGQVAMGILSADDMHIAASYLRKQNFYIINIEENKTFKFEISFLGKVKIKDLAVFCRQFAAMINAGMPIVTVLDVLVKQTPNKVLQKSLEDVSKQVEQGESLSVAMSNFKEVFPQLMITMIEAGEVGGVLDVVLDRLALQFEKQYKINEKTKSAMTYPLTVLSMAVFAIIFLLIFVLPTFAKMFVDMKMELPLITRIMLGASAFMQEHYILIIVLIFLFLIMLNFAIKKPKFKLLWSMMVLKLPVFGSLQNKIIIARFVRSLATLLRGGVPIIVSLETVENITGNLMFERAINNVQKQITTGLSLSKALAEDKLFPVMVVQMVAVGEDSGTIDTMLDKVADFYESEVDDTVSRLSSLLEPIMIVFLGSLIGGIVVAVISPMFDAITNIGK